MDGCIKCKDGFTKIVLGESDSLLKVDNFKHICVNASETNCQVGTYYDSELQQCIVCKEGCLECSSLDTCVTPCDPTLCKECSGTLSTCLSCNETSSLLKSHNKCINNCGQQPGYYEDLEIGQCFKCSDNCTKCTNSEQCNECEDGFFLYRNPLTKMSKCINDCQAFKHEKGIAYFNDLKTKSCQRCSEGCMQCQDDRKCQVCREMTLTNKEGQCSCIFNYQVLPSFALERLTVETLDFNWHLPLMNRPLPCSVFFQAFMRDDNVCMAYHFYMPMKQLDGINLLDNFMCEAQGKVDFVYSKPMKDFQEVERTSITIHKIPGHLIRQLVDGNIQLKLNQQAFLRKGCQADNFEDYSIKFWKTQEPYPQDSGNGTNSSGPSNNTDHPNNNNQSKPVSIILNTHKLMINKCDTTIPARIEIVSSRGFETGFNNIQWMIEWINSELNINEVDHKILEIEEASQDKLIMDLQGLVNLVNEERKMINLNVSVYAENMQENSVNKSIEVLITNNRRFELIVDQSKYLIPTSENFSFQPWLVTYKCEGVERIKIVNTTTLESMNVTLTCSLINSNGDYVATLSDCSIPKDTLEQGTSYTFLYTFSSPNDDFTQSGKLDLRTDISIPYCKIHEGTKIVVSPSKILELNAVSRNAIDLAKYKLQWQCHQLNRETGMLQSCTGMNIDQEQNSKLWLANDALQNSGSYAFTFNIMEISKLQPLSNCSIQVDVLGSEDISVLKFWIKADINERKQLTRNKNYYNFICESPEVYSIQMSYQWQLVKLSDSGIEAINLTSNADISLKGKYLQVRRRLFEDNQDYEVQCIASSLPNQTSSNQSYFGKAIQSFTTRLTEQKNLDNLQLSINPSTGLSYTTDFEVTASSTSTKTYKCQIVYTDPTSSKKLRLMESSKFEGDFNYGLMTKLPTGNVTFTLGCEDVSGQQYIVTKVVEVTNTTLSNETLSAQLEASLTSNDTNQVYQTFQMITENQKRVNATQRSATYQKVLQVLSDSESDHDSSSQDLNGKLMTLYQIASDMVTDESFKTDKDMYEQSIGFLAKTLQINLNDNIVGNKTSLERPYANESASLTKLDPITFTRVVQVAEVLFMTNLNQSDVIETKKQAVVVMLDAAKKVAGSLLPQEESAIELDGFRLNMKKIDKDFTQDKVELTSINTDDNYTYQVKVDHKDQVFSQYENLIFKQAVVDQALMKDTLKQLNVSTVPSNTTHKANKAQKMFASNIIIVDASTTPEGLSIDDTFQIQQLKVQNLTTPVYFEMRLPTLVTPKDNLTEVITDCVYFDTVTQDWKKNECNLYDNSNIANNTVKCCSYHLTQFAVTQTIIEYEDITPIVVVVEPEIPIEYSDDRFVQVACIIFGVFGIIGSIIGCILDRKGVYLLYETEEDPKKKAFYDLRTPPHSQASSHVMNSGYQQQAVPVVMGIEAQRRPPQQHHQVSQDEDSSVDHSQQQYEGGSDEEAGEDNQAHELQQHRNNKKQHKKKRVNDPNQNSQTKLFDAVDDQHKQKKKKKKQQQKQKKSSSQSENEGSDTQAKKQKSSNSDDDDELSNANNHDAMTKGEVDETNRANRGQGILAVDVSSSNNNGPSPDESYDSPHAQQHENPNDLSSIRPLRNEKRTTSQNKYATQSNGQNNQDHLADQMSFGHQYKLSIQVYTRIVGVFFKDAPFNSRPNKVISAVLQFAFILLITGLFTIPGELEVGAAVILTLLLMRVLQILVNLAFSKQPVRDRALCRNILIGILFTIIIIIVDSIMVRRLVQDRTVEEIDNWKKAFIATFFVEIIVFDFLVIPLVISASLMCCCVRASRRFLNPALSQLKKEKAW